MFIGMILISLITPTLAQESSPIANQIDGYPIVLDGQELFRVRQGIPGATTAEERAKIINQRLDRIASDAAIMPDSIRIEEQSDASIIKAGETTLFTVRESDREGDQTRQQLAEKAVQILRPAITDYRQSRSAKQLIQGILFTALSTLALILFLLFLQRLVSKSMIRLKAATRADTLDLRLQNFQILGSAATGFLLAGLLQLVRLVLMLVCLYLYIPFVLSQFPATRAIGDSIFNDIIYRINQLASGFIYYLPNLAMIVIITFLTYYVIQFAKLVIIELGRDDAYPWFYPEWIRPTIRLATFLIIAIALVIIGPYLPGFGSPAFQGISLFLGALLTLGSSSAVANTISGIILIYTRAFKIGDLIRINDITGEVVEKSLFVTRVLTPKQELITIPNSSVLNSNVINFSAISREAKSYLVLHTTITLGYDIPWRTVHEVLIEAAKATTHIVSNPAPFVLQTSLNDYNISYEVNAHTNCPQLMPIIYSELHQNIQDYCNQAGIEILSPAFSALRDGNHSTIPASYLPADYTAPSFQVQNQNHHSS
jgi:small-conductance mechanosensitive channel